MLEHAEFFESWIQVFFAVDFVVSFVVFEDAAAHCGTKYTLWYTV